MRYYIDPTLDPDEHPGMAAHGDDTVGIVDNAQGGVILYCHAESAEHIASALIWQDHTRPKEN